MCVCVDFTGEGVTCSKGRVVLCSIERVWLVTMGDVVCSSGV